MWGEGLARIGKKTWHTTVHQRDQGWISGVNVGCELILLVVYSIIPRGISSGTPAFPFSPTFQLICTGFIGFRRAFVLGYRNLRLKDSDDYS